MEVLPCEGMHVRSFRISFCCRVVSGGRSERGGVVVCLQKYYLRAKTRQHMAASRASWLCALYDSRSNSSSRGLWKGAGRLISSAGALLCFLQDREVRRKHLTLVGTRRHDREHLFLAEDSQPIFGSFSSFFAYFVVYRLWQGWNFWIVWSLSFAPERRQLYKYM